jgi:hypothetical protein
MRYILLSDFDRAEEFDDGLYVLRTRVTEDTDPSESTMELFSDGDLYRIRKRAPAEADAIAFADDDWMYFNSKETLFFEFVFKQDYRS